MDDRSDELLHERLDRLEERGRAALTMAARKAAWRHAVDLAARASIVVPGVSLVAAMIGPIAVFPVVIFAVVVPLVILVVAMAVRMARFHVERRTALALVDRSLALKDRAVMAAEFLGDDRQDGFRHAALQEAAPWLDRAAFASVGIEVHDGNRPWYRWAAPLLAVLMLIVALTIRPSSSVQPGEEAPSTLRRIAMAAGLYRNPEDADAARHDEAAQGQDHMTIGETAGAGSAAGSQAAGMRATAMGKGGSASGDPRRALGQSQGGGDASSTSAGTGPSDGGGAAGRTGSAQSERQPGDGENDRRNSDAKTGQAGEAAAPESRATSPSGPRSGAAAGLSAPAGSPPQPRDPGSNQDPPRSGSRSRKQSGQQSQGSGRSGRANTNAQQGSNRGDGQEGAKRARGSSSLMLAVPMEDRVIGTVNAGAVSTTTRNVPPRIMATGMVAAQARGSGQGPDAQMPHRVRSVQEDRLLERYFARAGVER
ncbi:hypothetical protein [Sphingomonas sp.]|uniref:hypothetical protein n=1 Tax=Sphingomonas sp. TaxID=28214 RepID=UPI0031D7747C